MSEILGWLLAVIICVIIPALIGEIGLALAGVLLLGYAFLGVKKR